MSYRRSPIKSIQYGTIAFAAGDTSKTAILSPAVTAANAYVEWLGSDQTNAGTATAAQLQTHVILTNGTTVTGFRHTAVNNSCTVAFCVVELYPFAFKTIQPFSVTMNGAATGTATLSPAVVVASTQLIFGGVDYDTADALNATAGRYFGRLALTNTTTVTGTRNDTGNICILYGAAVEYP